ncbi:MAG TPA: PLP-dependent aspartate aminotransferase family protein [Armatimonadota bacterium]|jgi:cystathionine beta-lyase/cystathionine gamma-synthase
MPVKFATKAIRAGQDPDPGYCPAVQPIYQASTYVQSGFNEHKGFDYSRTGNPNRASLETCLASLEGAKYGVAFGSGLAAVDGVASLAKPGDHILGIEGLYGGTYRLFDQVLPRRGVEVSFAPSDPESFAKHLRANTVGVWLESPTNPLLNLVDLKAMVALVRDRAPQAWMCVDNTFATPYLQQPLELGVDISLHSTTKYVGGHSDVVGGAVLTSRDDLHEWIRFYQNAVGAVPGPFDCWLALRGLRTLAVRMEAHVQRAQAIARFLESHPSVERVHYPGLESHPHHALAQRQMRGPGGIISFSVKGGLEKARAVATSTKVFLLAESLGAVESLICHPFSMTHHAVPADVKLATGIGEGLLRLSIGLEDPDDLVADLDQALGA